MALPVEIVRISQDMDLDSGELVHFAIVKLPSGRQVRALVEDSTAQAIINEFVSSGGKPKIAAEPPPTLAAIPASDAVSAFATEQTEDGPVEVFGGDAYVCHRNGASPVVHDEDGVGQI